jgi:hypothetical protein
LPVTANGYDLTMAATSPLRSAVRDLPELASDPGEPEIPPPHRPEPNIPITHPLPDAPITPLLPEVPGEPTTDPPTIEPPTIEPPTIEPPTVEPATSPEAETIYA